MRWRAQQGFTLLEVMVALAILGISLGMVVQAQQMSMRRTARAKMLTVATQLARWKLIEIEDDLFSEGFSDFDQEEKGDFKDQGFENITYVLKVDKIELPNVNQETLQEGVQEAGGEGGATAGLGAASLGAGMIGGQFEMFRSVLEDSIRRVTLKVIWKEGKIEKNVSVGGYFTDVRRVDRGGAPPPPPPPNP